MALGNVRRGGWAAMLKRSTQTDRWPQPDAIALLQRHAALRSLAGPEWDAALADATVVRSKSSRTQAFESCQVGHFGIVLNGTIRIRSVSADGRTLGICRVQAGELCMQSLAAIYSDHEALVEVASEGKVVALQIPEFHLPILLSASEAFRGFLLASMSKHVMTLLDRIEKTTFGSLKSRILVHLREMQEGSGCKFIAASHQELAEELGASREAVSRSLKQLERSGEIRLARRRISLVEVSTEVSTPVACDDSSSVKEICRLTESFEPKSVPQRQHADVDPAPEEARFESAESGVDDLEHVQPDPADPLPKITTQAPQRTLFRHL